SRGAAPRGRGYRTGGGEVRRRLSYRERSGAFPAPGRRRADQGTTERVELSIRGRQVAVPAVRVGEGLIVVSPGWLKISEVKDEAWLAGDVVADPEACITALRHARVRVDLFTFSQKPPDVTPRYPYHMEWDNLAVIPTSDFKEWWEHRVPQETR